MVALHDRWERGAGRWWRRRLPRERPPARVTTDPPAADAHPTVVWLRNRCPHCAGTDLRTYKTLAPDAGDGVTIRWHFCRTCGRERWWKSHESE